MKKINTNEREFQGEVLHWLGCTLIPPFAEVTQETTVAGLFPDIVVWLDRNAGLAAFTMELKDTQTDVRDGKLLANGNRKALVLHAKFLVTWNMKDVVVWSVSPSGPKELWHYPVVPVTHPKKWQAFKTDLKQRATDILIDIDEYQRTGQPPQRITIESTIFIESVYTTVESLVPLFQNVLRQDPKEVAKWAVQQGVPTDDGYITAARHVIYRLIGKLLFYHALSQIKGGNLKPLINLEGVTPSEFQDILNKRFECARQIDYEAIFEPRFPDRLTFTEQIASFLRHFCSSLHALDLQRISTDVIGRIFEALIPSEDKHRLGQYFTEAPLSDLLVSFAVRHPHDLIFDPTCGTGGILIRAYALLHWLSPKRPHSELLKQVWGNEIADFPAELATINLYRQDPADVTNFPRILIFDIFALKPESTVNLTGAKGPGTVPTKLPQFDAIVGNPPYVRRQEIGQWQKKPLIYREKLWKQLPYLDPEGDLFCFVFGQSSLYLKDGGRLSFVTSNAWLEAEYGASLQTFFLTHFKIIAILESRCEPWFENADVNTVVTVLEKCPEVPNHKVKFVSLKKPLQEIFPQSVSDLSRYAGYFEFVAKVEQATSEVETDQYLIRSVPQSQLLTELLHNDEINKWGHYLRAPAVFERLLYGKSDYFQKLSEVLAIDFGTLTGKNEFYCPTENQPGYARLSQVENQFKVKTLRSIKHCESYILKEAECKGILFSCCLPEEQLGGTNALQYIKWGSRQIDQDGKRWPESGEMRNRDPWYSTRTPVRGDVIFQMFIGARHFCPANTTHFPVLNNVLAGTFQKAQYTPIGIALLNSSWFALVCELYGRINLGGGALKIERTDLRVMPIPSLRLFQDKSKRRALLDSFNRMAKRSPLPITQELADKDRRSLDAVVFDALELTADERTEIYESIERLASARVQIAKLRTARKESRVERDVGIVMEDIISEVLPAGILGFPEKFMGRGIETEKHPVPSEGLKVIRAPRVVGQKDLWGLEAYELIGAEGYSHTVQDARIAEYINCSQNGKPRHVAIPKDLKEIERMLTAYQAYLKKLHSSFVDAVFRRILASRRADAVVTQIFESLGIRSQPLSFKNRLLVNAENYGDSHSTL